MANANWISNAQARPDVWWATPAAVQSTSWFALTINDKTLKVYAGAKDSSGTATTIDAAGIVQLMKEAIEATDIAEWKELTPTMGILYDQNKIETVDSLGTTLILTGPDDGKPVTITSSSGTTTTPTVLVTEVTKGVAGANEKQSISFGSTATGGTFTLSFAGQTTGNIAYNADAATLETAFEGLSSVGAGNGTVSGTAGAWVVEFTGTLAQTNVPLITGDGSLLTGAGRVDITTTVQGSGNITNERVFANFFLQSGVTYRFGFRRTSSDAYSYTGGFTSTSSDSVIQSLIDSAIGSGHAILTHPAGGYYIIEFIGSWGGTNLPDDQLIQEYLSYNGVWSFSGYLAVLQQGGGITDEVQQITVYKATGGHFHLIFQGETTGAITYSATPATLAANIDAALEALTGIGAGNIAVTVSSSTAVSDIFLATFGGTLAGVDVQQMTSDATSLTGGSIQVATTQAAVTAINEVQQISLSDNPSGGTFTLSYGGYTTTALTYDESASDVHDALEALTSIGAGQVTVAGNAGGPWTVTFGGTLAGTDVALITGSGYGLVLSGTQSVALCRIFTRKYTQGTWVQSTRVFTPSGAVNPINDGVAVGDAAQVFTDSAIGGAAYMSRVTARDATTITLSADAIEGTPPTDGTATRTLLIVTAPTGPNFYDDVANWEGDALPADSDTLNAEDGSGAILYNTNQSLVTLAAINLKASFTGHSGLGRTDANDYWEYRPQYITLGNATDAVTTTITIGQGDGDGTGHFWLNSGSGQVAIKVHNLAPSADANLPAFVWKGTHVSNTMEVLKGSVGVALFAGEAAAIATLTIGYINSQDRDATVTIGSGCTTITTINKFGGTLNLYTGATTLIQDGGETLHVAGAIGTLTLNGGTYIHQNAGNITTLNIYGDAVADFSRGDSAVTITNCTIYGKNAPVDPHKRITFTNPPAYKGGGQLTLDWGTTYSIQRS